MRTAGAGGIVAAMLIPVAQLRQHLHDASWIVFDCRHDLVDHSRGARVYGEGHIPGAYFAPVETALAGRKNGRNGRHPLPSPEDFAGFLAGCGVTTSTQIVAYDDAGGQYAARLWWLARWIGLSAVGVLDGGLPQWLVAGGPVTGEVPLSRAGGQVPARAGGMRVVTAAQVAARIGGRTALIIDARAAERYRGEVEPVDPVAGRIPSACNRFFKDNLRADLTLRPAGDLRREFEALLEGRSPSEVIHHCGSGVTACVNLLAMEHAGLPGAALYAGSWSEWISDPSRPVARG